MAVEGETTRILDQAFAGALRQMIECLDGATVIKVFELASREDQFAELAAGADREEEP